MPLLFSYGSLQREDVQLSTFGRRLDGQRDELLGFEQSLVKIEDAQVAAAIGKTHHANVKFNGSEDSRVPGTVFQITDAELASVDKYEAAFLYERLPAILASGKQAWMYVHAPGASDRSIATVATTTEPNVQQAVPFFGVRDILDSVRFYVQGLGFTMTKQWLDEGKLRWCWLELGDAAVMLQEFSKAERPRNPPDEKIDRGISIYFICKDAVGLWREFVSRGLDAKRPSVGNGMWVTHVSDPDGYELYFESSTDVPEETIFSDDR